jgi:DNA-binding HxlR family transcriptional regulator
LPLRAASRRHGGGGPLPRPGGSPLPPLPSPDPDGNPGKTYGSQVCSIARALEVVGERWSLLIVRDALFAGTTRYVEFQRRLRVATNVLQSRLDGFVSAGIMERQTGSSAGPEYVLTAKGRDLAPALIALTQWGDRWAAPDGPPIRYIHETCGAAVRVDVTCASCGTLTGADEVLVRPGPGMPPEHLEQMAAARAAR